MRGPNTRALEARQKKKEAQQEKQEIHRKLAEENSWRDEFTESKLKKKEVNAQKLTEKLNKKLELKKLEDEETKFMKANLKSQQSAPKMTRVEIQRRALQASLELTKNKEAELSHLNIITENPNHLLLEKAMQARLAGQELVVTAKVDDFLNAVEKRKKAAFADYEEEWYSRLRDEFPGLKRSQIKGKIWKQWLKAPENPMNQPRDAQKSD